MRVICWNTQWHRGTSWQGAAIRNRLFAAQAEIICCPEAYEDFLPDEWHGIFSQQDTGYPIKPGRRKVTLWSRHPWAEIDDLGSDDLPSGRFVRATTTTSLGPVDVIGICIPWSAAHVSNGRRDRQRWEDHLLYLHALKPLLLRNVANPTVIIGDFNQALPRRTAPIRAHDELQVALRDFDVWTVGAIAGIDTFPVCHIASSAHFTATDVAAFSRLQEGRALSDHDGLIVDLALR